METNKWYAITDESKKELEDYANKNNHGIIEVLVSDPNYCDRGTYTRAAFCNDKFMEISPVKGANWKHFMIVEIPKE